MRVVVGLDLHRLAFDHPLGDRDADHRGHPLHRAEEAAQGGQVVDAEVEQGAAARLVEPPTPPRAGPAVAGAAEQQPADLAGLHPSVHLLVGLRQHDVRGADELAGPRSSAASTSSAASDSDVAIGFSTSTCLPAASPALASGPCSFMLVSTSTASTSSLSITSCGPAVDGSVPNRSAVSLPLLGVDVVGRRELDASLEDETLDEGGVGPREDAAESEDSEPDGHV